MLIALTTAIVSYSQSGLTATLSHNGGITTFYGKAALQEAHEASQHGDIITLSSGTFMATDITKALTIRGAGMHADSVACILPTIISGDFNINVPDSIEQHLTMEGIYSNDVIYVQCLKDAVFLKDRFYSFTYDGNNYNSLMKNLTFVHCKVTAGLHLSANASVTCINCYITYPSTYGSTLSHFDFTNCIIVGVRSSLRWSSLTNCIVRMYDSGILDGSNTALNCLGYETNGDIFRNTVHTNCTLFTGELNTLFKTYKGTYNDDESFELTDEAKALYIGSDLKQVGMYGGSLPFSPIPTNPRIVKCNVASESTSDGKLSVDIEVSNAE